MHRHPLAPILAALFGLLTPCGASFAEEADTPTLACWFWHEEEFEEEGYRPWIDLVAERSHYEILTTSLRVMGHELSDRESKEQIARAVDCAKARGIGIAMDLDVRLDRTHHRRQHPDEMQWMVRLRETVLDEFGQGEIRAESALLVDHYTHNATPYVSLSGKVERVYLFDRDEEGALVEVRMTDRWEAIDESPEAVTIRVDAGPEAEGKTVCLLAAFEHFAPDVFGPNLLEYQADLIQSYSGIPLVGVCKDEWGFPPDFEGCPAKNDYWFSEPLAAAYAEQSEGRDLLRDFLLMTHGEAGRESERIAAINRLLRMSTLRNGEIESHFYDTVKSVFGPEALVATHPTWYPYPGVQEFMKNGLSWWIAKRDIAQTDETTPYCVRTSLSKKWGGPWQNMFYAEDPEKYSDMMWRDALAGGRINYHPPWPTGKVGSLRAGQEALLEPDRIRGDQRVRLIDSISNAPLDCPVAVIFGHAAAMNWAGPCYAETGVDLADRFWRAGYPADLIPSSEIWNGSIRVSPEGRLTYGPQEYAAVVFLHPEYEPAEIGFFLKVIDPEDSGLILLGDRTRDFKGNPVDPLASVLPNLPMAASEDDAVKNVLSRLSRLGIEPQSGATGELTSFGYRSAAPGRNGQARLLDGTRLFIGGENSVSGDRVRNGFEVEGIPFFADYEGVLAVRFDKNGSLEALAAGGLKEFRSGVLILEFDEPLDITLTRDPRGGWRGRHRSVTESPPEAFNKETIRWERVAPLR